MVMNKKGQEGVSIGTIIGIIIAVIVLIVVIVFFTGGFGGIAEKLQKFTGAGASVETVIQACSLASSNSNSYLFCEDFSKVSFPTGVEYINCQDSRVAGKISGAPLVCKDVTGPDQKTYNVRDNFCRKTAETEALKSGAKDSAAYPIQFTKACTALKVNGELCTNCAP